MAKILIVRPEGLEMPEDVEAGEPFDVLAKVCFRDNGKLEIKSIDGIKFDESDTEYEDEAADEYAEAETGEEDALVLAMKGMGRA